MSASLQVNYRNKKGKSYRNALFSKGMVPGVVYGKTVGAIPVEVEIKPFRQTLQAAKGGVVDLTVQGLQEGDTGNYKVLVKDIQIDPIKQIMMNIDFHQISMEEAVATTVAIDFTGDVKIGIVQTGIRELQISCLPDKIPASIAVDISGMEVGATVLVRDLELPEDVKPLDDPDIVVVTVLGEQKEEVKETEEETEAEAEASEEA